MHSFLVKNKTVIAILGGGALIAVVSVWASIVFVGMMAR